MTDTLAPIAFLSGPGAFRSWGPHLESALAPRPVMMWSPDGPKSGPGAKTVKAEDFAYAITFRPPEGVFGAMSNLKAVFSMGAGVEAILAHPELPQDLPVVRVIDPNLTMRMSEWVVYTVLHFHRQMPVYQMLRREKRWGMLAQRGADEVRVGILGMGELGRDAAERLRDLRFQVAGWSRTPKDVPGVESFAGEARLEAFLARTEILVCLLPLTSDTQHILRAETIAMLPKGAVVINAGRGGHIKTEDLMTALDSGHLGGAGLDVFEQEPLPADHRIWSHPKVFMTPHVAAMTDPRTVAGQIAQNITLIETGKTPPGLVDKARGY